MENLSRFKIPSNEQVQQEIFTGNAKKRNQIFGGLLRIKLTLVSLLVMANSLLCASAVGKFDDTLAERYPFRKCLQECALSAEPLLDEYEYCAWQCSRLREKRGKFFMMGR
ncbi:hypothetical protein T265_07482 [Opisthorchis viverrini]|uniref:Uncharacterized protein n=1 Tax=Opisthorchis viverrini TaxID=6198 RepID=A0A074ZCF5_OPIVI|nr:hypothetical protein T265_07482 [Opisthorchis viverrini]KER24976.1 hypothetical protein T265_07482 [Opisthorchis viverrini]